MTPRAKKRTRPASPGTKGQKSTKRGRRKWPIVVAVAALGLGAWWWSNGASPHKATPIATEGAALQKTRQRAEQGDVPAQMELAQSYCVGKGVKKNVFQCAEWYRKAANLGNGSAMLRLGDLYASGEGFMQDKNAAAMWWRKAQATAAGADGAKTRLREIGADANDRK